MYIFCSLLVRLLIYPTVCPFRKTEDESLFIHLAEIHCIAGMSAMPGAGEIEVKVKRWSSSHIRGRFN